MARKAHPSDFEVQVEDVGTFTFGRRRMADEIAIQVSYARMLDGAPATEWLALVAGWISTLRVLTVSAPEGWDIEEMDPLDDETYANLSKVHAALIEKERSFRLKPETNGKGTGAEAG